MKKVAKTKRKRSVDESINAGLRAAKQHCDEPGCDKSAQGKSSRCIGHGGGKRCDEPGCDKSAQGKSSRCIGHGGGNRCDEPGCDKSAQGKTSKCKAGSYTHMTLPTKRIE